MLISGLTKKFWKPLFYSFALVILAEKLPLNSSKQYSTSIIPSVRSRVFQQVLDNRAEMMEMSTVNSSAFVFLRYCFSLESEKCLAHVGVLKIIALTCAPICLSCVWICMLACAWPASQCECMWLLCLGAQCSVTAGAVQPREQDHTVKWAAMLH